MNSSISNFKTEIKVLIVVAVMTLAFEGYVRYGFVRENYYNCLRGYLTQSSQEFAKAQTQPKLLFLGNSLIHSGFDRTAFIDELKSMKLQSPYVSNVYIMSSRVCEWYYMLRNYFIPNQAKPDALVFWFSLDHLLDQAGPQKQVLPNICDFTDLPRILAGADTFNFDDRMELTLCFLSMGYRFREEFRHDLFNRLIHDYKNNMDKLYGRTVAAPAKSSAPAAAPAKPHYQRLERMLATIKSLQIPALFVAMPLKRSSYPVDFEVIRMIQNAGFGFMDCRQVAGISQDWFRDDLHLGKNGAALFSRYFAKQLMEKYPSFVDIKAMEPAPAAPASKVATSNLLSSPNFDNLSLFWPVHATGTTTVTQVTEPFMDQQPIKMLQVTSNQDVQIFSEHLPIEPGKAYRFSVWMKHEATPVGSVWFGLHALIDNDAAVPVFKADNQAEANPYFWLGNHYSDNQWHQLVGYLLPSNAAANWKKIPDSNSTDYRMPPETKMIRMRLLSYYNNGKITRAWFAKPMIEPVDLKNILK